jgi:hypothetical protein
MSSEKPKVVVVMPHYGQVDLGAARGFLLPSTRGDVELVTLIDAGTSCTPRAFNMCLIQALNLRDEGKITHMAMIHSDVNPTNQYWLDILWREMRIHHADYVASVIPIKDPQPCRSSTAIGDISNPWECKRYLPHKRPDGMPETVLPSDVCGEGEELLVNTGLFLTDLRAEWWDGFPGFQFHNRLIMRDGERIEQFRPEDWELSRHMRAAGACYAATYAVPVQHFGSFGWSNR